MFSEIISIQLKFTALNIQGCEGALTEMVLSTPLPAFKEFAFHFPNIKPSDKLKTKQGLVMLSKDSTFHDQQPAVLEQWQNASQPAKSVDILANAQHLHCGQIPRGVCEEYYWKTLMKSSAERNAD